MLKGLKLILSGPSGVGKGTITPKFVYWMKSMTVVKSVTTRAQRFDDTKYVFVSREEFGRMREAGELLEFSEHFGHLYGTPRNHMNSWGDQLIEVDCRGAFQIKEKIPEIPSVCLLAKTPEVLEQRLRSRGTGESEEEFLMRRDKAFHEVEAAGQFDYWLLNEHADVTAALLVQLAMMLQKGIRPDPQFRNMDVLHSVQKEFRRALQNNLTAV